MARRQLREPWRHDTLELEMRSFTLSTLATIALFGTMSAAVAQQQGNSQPHTMDMNQSMARCAQIRQQAQAGAPQSPQLRQMLDQCDQMDRSMGMTPPARR